MEREFVQIELNQIPNTTLEITLELFCSGHGEKIAENN